MGTVSRVLGPASTNFDDYLGTAAADDADVVKDRPSLYELADIDRDRYTILAVDLRIDGPVTATVYAIDRLEHGITRQGEIAELSHSRGTIPVVPFHIHAEANAIDLILHASEGSPSGSSRRPSATRSSSSSRTQPQTRSNATKWPSR